MKRILATLAVLALSASAVLAHDFTLGDLDRIEILSPMQGG